ncbi:alpha/beta hydrolase [soil metagenome]
METVISQDGTHVAFERTGSGPPLLLVHGMAGMRGRWASILPALSAEFTVCTMDRRGRGGSGDSERYEIECEFEDVAAVVDSFSEPVNVLGHSYGGTCALEAALLTDNIGKLILYEPGAIPPDVPVEESDLADRLDALLASGDREDALVTFLHELVGMSEREIQEMRQTDTWEARLAICHTLPREIRAEDGYRFIAGRFAEMRVPTMLLTGGDSPPNFSEPVWLVDAGLPISRVVVMPGQQHIADMTAPDLFVREVVNFLRD